jgi:membrane protein DedA with SNARE-associated domain
MNIYIWVVSGLLGYAIMILIGKKLGEWSPTPEMQIVNVIGSIVLGPIVLLVIIGTTIIRFTNPRRE